MNNYTRMKLKMVVKIWFPGLSITSRYMTYKHCASREYLKKDALFGGPTFLMPLRRAPERSARSEPPIRRLLRCGLRIAKSGQKMDAFFCGPTFLMPLRRTPERPAGTEPPLRGLLRYGIITAKSTQKWSFFWWTDLLNAIETRSWATSRKRTPA